MLKILLLAAALGVALASTTQAGCKCIDGWQDRSGMHYTGCANPNSDPKGAWCAVDGGSCPGYYGYTDGYNGARLFYDYCGSVRERTVGGCLCNPTWSIEGFGKEYEDRCANPASPTERTCAVSLATCNNITATSVYDACAPLVANATTKNTTYNNCSCVGWPAWPYVYSSGANVSFTSCANPDGDPLGAWCAVDPTACGRFAGQLNLPNGAVVNYDYCGSPAPNTRRNGSVCTESPREFEQCGGKSNCTEFGCADEAWPGVCCPSGLACVRQNQFYWQCLTPEEEAALVPPQQQESGERPAEQPSPVVTLPIVAAPPAASPVANLKVPGKKIYTTVTINYDYAKLLELGAMTKFKDDLTAWLASVAGYPEYIYAIVVESVKAGSVVADASVTYTADAPQSAVDASTTNLKNNGAAAYSSSGLPTTYGLLVGYSINTDGTLSSGTVAGTGADAQPIGSASGGFVKTAGFWAVIGVCAACVVGLAGFAVARGLADEQAKEADALGKTAQLAYINEQTEAEIAAELYADGKLGEGELSGPLVDPSGDSRLWAWLGGIPKPDDAQLASQTLARTNFGIPAVRPAPSEVATTAPAPSDIHVSSLGVALSPRSQIMATDAEGAFLPVPDGEEQARATGGGAAGVAYANMRQRTAGGTASTGVSGGGYSSLGTTPRARDGGTFSPMGNQLSKFGSNVAAMLGMSGAPPTVPEQKDH